MLTTTSDAERILTNLYVLATLTHNDKLMTNGDIFCVYTPTTLRALFRGWYGEGRVHNLQRVRECVRGGVRHAISLYEEARLAQDACEKASSEMARPDVREEVLRFRVDTLWRQHVRMCEALDGARVGISHLHQTYRDDAALVSHVLLIMRELDDFAVTRSTLPATPPLVTASSITEVRTCPS